MRLEGLRQPVAVWLAAERLNNSGGRAASGLGGLFAPDTIVRAAKIPAKSGNFESMPPLAFQEKLARSPDPVLLDVRMPEEFSAGHLEGASLLDFYDPGFREALAALPRDRDYFVYCRSGNRSGQAMRLMGEMGFARVTDLRGGIRAWQNEGLPVVEPLPGVPLLQRLRLLLAV